MIYAAYVIKRRTVTARMKSASRRRSNSRLRSIDTISGRNKNNVVTDCSVNDRTTNDDKNRKFDVSDGTKADLIFVEKKFRSGDRFEGYYNKKSGKREGFGLYIWHNGDSYKGFWVSITYLATLCHTHR